jgi:hypothetical protein
MEKEWSQHVTSKILENAFTLNIQDITALKSLYQDHTKFQSSATYYSIYSQPPPEIDNTNKN